MSRDSSRPWSAETPHLYTLVIELSGDADAEREAAEREGEARRILEAKTGQGDQARLTAQAEGRKAAADALQREKEAEAAVLEVQNRAMAQAGEMFETSILDLDRHLTPVA